MGTVKIKNIKRLGDALNKYMSYAPTSNRPIDMTLRRDFVQRIVNEVAELEERITIMQERMETLEKRNEPKQPKWFTDIHNPAGAYKCGVCEERIVEKDVDFYCSNCGQAVKWK